MKWMIFQSELWFLIMGGVFLVLAMLPRHHPRRDHLTAVVMALVGMAICLASIHFSGDLFFQTYRIDRYSQVFKVILAMGLFLVVMLCDDLSGVEERLHPEFYALLSLCTLAMMLLVSCVHLLTIYVSLELSSYCLYILVAMRRERRVGSKSGLKYFLIGAAASAVMLFGLALLYGATGATYVVDLIKALPPKMAHPMVAVGLMMTLGGFFFKLAVFPFHFWAPEAYAGAPNQVAAYIASASKVGAIAILLRVVAMGGSGAGYLVHLLILMAVASMTVGNLSAIVQKDFKRLLAFSSVAQAGYILVGIAAMNAAGFTSAVFYAVALLLMKLTCFMVVVLVAGEGRNPSVAQLAGLHRRAPLLALALMIALFGLAGIPPTIGFTGKLLLFRAAMQQGYFYLVLIAMVNVVISLYYYLLVIKAAYLLEPSEPQAALRLSLHHQALAGFLILAMLLIGFYPRYLMDVARSAALLLL
jgi:NADH-quinone oxidoreductase subunit N